MKKIRESITAIFGEVFRVEIRMSTLQADFKLLTANAIRNKSDYVIFVGGDGSINEGVNGYFDTEVEERKNSILGVLPAGSGNDFSKSLGVSNDLDQLLELINSGSATKIDVGLMSFIGVEGEPEKRYFINIADIGIGGFVTKKISKSKKRLGGDFTYTKAILQSFYKYKKQEVHLTSDDYSWSGKAFSICMANGNYFGSGLCIAPDATLTDGRMQLVIIGDVKLSDYLRNIPKIKKGEKIKHDEVRYSFAEKCEILSIGASCPIDMDGEYVGTTPLKVEIKSKQIPFLISN